MGKIEAVILDWAGTTVDFGCFAPVQAFVESFKSFGIIPTLEEVREPMGMLKWEHVHTMMKMPRITSEWKKVHGRDWTNDDVEKIYQNSESLLMEVLERYSDPKPYVVDTIEELRKRKIKIGSTTGYIDKMMDIVIPNAERQGYFADVCFSPDSVNGMGRPYPFMIFKNMEYLRISSVKSVIKVGDTVSDIKEANHAGVISVGVLEGSSIMGLSLNEYEKLSIDGKELECERVSKVYRECGADYIIKNMKELCDLIDKIEKSND